MKIIVVDDYKIFRTGLISVLNSYKKYNIIGEVANPEGLFNLLQKQRADVVILSLCLPQKHIISISNKISKNYPDIPLLLLAEGSSEFIILKCIVNGAKGILWKENTVQQLIEAIDKVGTGKKYLDVPESKIAPKINGYTNNHNFLYHDASELSERELEVLRLFAEGCSYKIIADKLKISPRTVESHKNNILLKLELDSVIDMVKYAIKHNLISI